MAAVASSSENATQAFPSWTWTLQNVRHVVVFGASALALAATFLA